jgi:hypothetical protein
MEINSDFERFMLVIPLQELEFFWCEDLETCYKTEYCIKGEQKKNTL